LDVNIKVWSRDEIGLKADCRINERIMTSTNYVSPTSFQEREAMHYFTFLRNLIIFPAKSLQIRSKNLDPTSILASEEGRYYSQIP
jgi:hypothetical protein